MNHSSSIPSNYLDWSNLNPYIRPIHTDAKILGNSKSSARLRQWVTKVAATQDPIWLQAPTGSGKTFISSLIHSKSSLQGYPFAEINLSQLPQHPDGTLNTDNLFGNGTQLGLLHQFKQGTLLIDHVHLLSREDCERLKHYITTGEILPNQPLATVQVRLILASPHNCLWTEIPFQSFKLPSLPQRKQDIKEFTTYFLEKLCQERKRSLLTIDQADFRRLLSYNYPENLAELENILKRAVIMTPLEETIIPEQVLWSVESRRNAFRIDLLNQIPWLRPFLLSKWWPEGFWIPMMAVFVPITLMGFIGSPSRDNSVTLNLFWAWWWPFYLILFPLIGRLWCAVCPFMITAEWVKKLSLWLFPRQLRAWNTKWLNQWGAWILWAGFVAIYLWEKLWDLPHSAYLSAWLLIIITLGAVICSLIYERRLWCRYLCPIGGMNGIFAKLAMLELRSTPQVCGSQCQTFGCYKGSEATQVNFINALPTEGQASDGCPLYSHPAQLQDNRDCMFCMTCLKTCPNRSAHFNLRFPATDIMEQHQETWPEIALLLLLLGGVLMHHSHTLLSWFGWGALKIDSEHLLVAIPVVIGLLSIPFLVTYLAHQITRFFDPEMPTYKTVIYAYLPLTLAANLVHYFPAMLTEAGNILPVLARNLGYSSLDLPSLTWDLSVAQFLQEMTLISILLFSLFPLKKITQRPLINSWPHLLLIGGWIILFFKLMVR
ncbi:MAG: sigma 54-interacting transcriptional regulator [Microcystaceae cyanobacterium]